VLTSIAKPDGSTVGSNEVIATIDTEAKGAAARRRAQTSPLPSKPLRSRGCGGRSVRRTDRIAGGAQAGRGEQGRAHRDQGSGRGGRITKEDVLKRVLRRLRTHPAPVTPISAAAPASARRCRRPWTSIACWAIGPSSAWRCRACASACRAAGAVAITAAILTTFNEVNMQPVIELRKKYQERFEKEHGVRLGFMSFFVKASVHALKKFPW
jgi:2-oxoglutarate dehydrogenase E2 component (dihydrolipoamide succinyltransferase)